MSVIAFPGDRRRIAPLEIDEVRSVLAYWRHLDAAISRGQTFDAKHLTQMLRCVAQDCEHVIRRSTADQRCIQQNPRQIRCRFKHRKCLISGCRSGERLRQRSVPRPNR